MVVRQWKARATAEGARAYGAHLEMSVLPQLRALPGFSGVSLLAREDEGAVELTVQTRWASMEAVNGFAAPEPGLAVVEPAAEAVLLGYDRKVTHLRVLLEG